MVALKASGQGFLIMATSVVLAVMMLGDPVQAEPSGYRRPGTIQRVSLKADGNEVKYGSSPLNLQFDVSSIAAASISSTGRYVAFSSPSEDLVPGDSNDLSDVFVKDMKTGRIEMVSVGVGGGSGLGRCLPLGARLALDFSSYAPVISASGRYIVFTSCAINLIPGDLNQLPDVFIRDMKRQKTSRVSIGITGGDAHGPSGTWPRSSVGVGISPNARFVVFTSAASDLVLGDTNGGEVDIDPDHPDNAQLPRDVFLVDRKSGKTERVNVPDGGEGEADGTSRGVSVSGDGRLVTFDSTASNLVEGDENGMTDVFIHNRRNDSTALISAPLDGASLPTVDDARAKLPIVNFSGRGSFISTANGQAMSTDGRFVVFSSELSNLVPRDSNGSVIGEQGWDTFVYDLHLKRVERVSVDSSASIETNRDFGPQPASISRDGRFVVWESIATNFVLHDGWKDTNNFWCYNCDSDVFMFDRRTGAQGWVSKPLDNLDGFSPRDQPLQDRVVNLNDLDEREMPRDSVWSSLSRDGRYVSFSSDDEMLVRRDKNETEDIYRADFGVTLGVGSIRTRPSMPGSRSFSERGFHSLDDAVGDVTQLAAGADIAGTRVAWRPQLNDLFLSMDLVEMGLNLDPSLYGLSLTVDGVRYEIRAQERPGSERKLLSPLIGLFSCQPSLPCVEISRLKGGIGTAGESVSVSLPIGVISNDTSIEISATAFSAFGTYLGGPIRMLDTADVGGRKGS